MEKFLIFVRYFFFIGFLSFRKKVSFPLRHPLFIYLQHYINQDRVDQFEMDHRVEKITPKKAKKIRQRGFCYDEINILTRISQNKTATTTENVSLFSDFFPLTVRDFSRLLEIKPHISICGFSFLVGITLYNAILFNLFSVDGR